MLTSVWAQIKCLITSSVKYLSIFFIWCVYFWVLSSCHLTLENACFIQITLSAVAMVTILV